MIVHGFPPERLGGTERYTATLGEGLAARGWEVHTVAAELAPGRPMYSHRSDVSVTRITQNTPYQGVRQGERDPAMARVLAEVIERFEPDILHLQHAQFMGVDLPARLPLVWTLHDAWAWCAAGGTLLRMNPDQPRASPIPCAGPGAACAGCTSAWVGDTPALAAMMHAGTRLGGLVGGDRLHRWWARLPAPVRGLTRAGRPAAVTPTMLAARDRNIRALAARATLVTPSRWLGAQAEAAGLPRPEWIPHGVPTGPARIGGGPLLFLGALALHKGPDLVWEAWRRSGVTVPLHLHGPIGRDPAWAARIPHRGPLAHAEVGPALAGATALVLGSRWPENAPLVILEARAAGCPIVAPNIGGIPEIVEHGVDGLLYGAGELDACAAAIREVVSRPFSPRPPLSLGAHLDMIEALYHRRLRR